MGEKYENIKAGNNINVGDVVVLNTISLNKEKKENINDILKEANTDNLENIKPDVNLTSNDKDISSVNVEPVAPVIPQVEIPVPEINPETASIPSVEVSNFDLNNNGIEKQDSLKTPIINNDISLADSSTYYKEENNNSFSYDPKPIENQVQLESPLSNFGSFNNNFSSYNNDMTSMTSSYDSVNTSYTDSNPIYDLLDEIREKIIAVTEETIKEAKKNAEGSVNALETYKKMGAILSDFVGGNKRK